MSIKEKSQSPYARLRRPHTAREEVRPMERLSVRSALPPFDFTQLQRFVVVADELNFCRAAARLNIAQSPLSRQIAMLERMLEVELFDRTNGVVRLTQAGQSFLREAQRLVRVAEAAVQLVRRVDEGQSGNLRIGFTAASSFEVLPNVLRICSSEFGDVSLELIEMVTKDQSEALLSGAMDVGLLRPRELHRDLDYRRIHSEFLVAAVPEAHRLAQRATVAPAEFDGEPFIMYAVDHARYLHQRVVQLLSEGKASPVFVHYPAQIHTMLLLVKAGLGCAIVPASAKALGVSGVVFLSLKAPRSPPIELWLSRRKDLNSPIVERLITLLKLD
jgi:DNA-binding transcriptional LysR family regulator